MEKQKHNELLLIEDSYLSISKTIAYLNAKNPWTYTEADIDDFVSRGRLTPCLPYKGKLLRIFDDEYYEFKDISVTEIDGFITPLDFNTTCKFGKLLSTEKVSFLNVKILFKPKTLIDFGFVEYRSRWSTAPYRTFESLGTFQKTVNEYQVIGGAGLYDFSEETGIEIQYHVYRSFVTFHLSQLDGFSDMPKSAKKTLFDTSINELKGTTPTQKKKGSKITRLKPAVLQAIIELGYDPIALPYIDPAKGGLDGVRKEVREYLARFEDTQDLTIPKSTFNNYYGILTRDGTLKEDEPPTTK